MAIKAVAGQIHTPFVMIRVISGGLSSLALLAVPRWRSQLATLADTADILVKMVAITPMRCLHKDFYCMTQRAALQRQAGRRVQSA